MSSNSKVPVNRLSRFGSLASLAGRIGGALEQEAGLFEVAMRVADVREERVGGGFRGAEVGEQQAGPDQFDAS